MLTSMRRIRRCVALFAPDGPLAMGLVEEKLEAAFVGGCLIELWTKMADNNTDRHIEAKNAPSEKKNRELRWRTRHYITKKKLRMHQEKIREESILKPDSDLFPTTILF